MSAAAGVAFGPLKPHPFTKMGQIHVGTSGFRYLHWRGVLYPQGLPERRWLDRYAQVFSTVELNATFYRLPTPETVSRWRRTVPAGFIFAAKGSRYLTHLKRLTDASTGLRRFYQPVRRLKEKLGVVLWQLPPQMKQADPERLDRFLAAQPAGVRQAVEFRSDAWYVPAVCEVLEKHGAAICEHDLLPRPPPAITGGFRYLRFHGATGKYAGRYGDAALRPWARSLERWRAQGKDAFVYFNNDLHGHAVADALALARRLELAPAREDDAQMWMG